MGSLKNWKSSHYMCSVVEHPHPWPITEISKFDQLLKEDLFNISQFHCFRVRAKIPIPIDCTMDLSSSQVAIVSILWTQAASFLFAWSL